MQSLFFFMPIPDESRVLGGNPSDVIDRDLARTGVSAGEKWAQQQQQQPEPEQQEHWHFNQNRKLQHLRLHRPSVDHSSCSWSPFWCLWANDLVFQHRGSSFPQHPHTVFLPACYATDYQPRDHQSARQCQYHFPHWKRIWWDSQSFISGSAGRLSAPFWRERGGLWHLTAGNRQRVRDGCARDCRLGHHNGHQQTFKDFFSIWVMAQNRNCRQSRYNMTFPEDLLSHQLHCLFCRCNQFAVNKDICVVNSFERQR